MATDTSDLIDAADLESPNLNPAYSIDPTYGVRATPLTTKEVFPETSSALLAPLSTTYTPPGTRVASLAPQPGQPVNLMQGADLSIPQPKVTPGPDAVPVQQPVQVAQNVPQGPGVAPPLRAPQPPPGSVKPIPSSNVPLAQPNAPETDYDQRELDKLKLQQKFQYDQGHGWFKNLMDPDDAKIQRADEEKTLDKIHDVEQRIQTKNTVQNMARNYHLFTPVANTADAASIPEQALEEARTQGNIGAWTALMGSAHAERAKGYLPEFMNSAGKDAVKANGLFEGLDNAATQPEYDIARNKLLKGAAGVNNAQYFGMTEGNIPKSQGVWTKQRGLIEGPVKQMTQTVNNYMQQQKDQTAPQPITDEGLNKTVVGESTKVSGEASPNAVGRTLPSHGGAKATLYTNSTNDIANYGEGQKWNDWNTPQRQAAAKLISENPEIKGVLDQNNMAIKFNKATADDNNYKDSTGRTLIADSAAGTFRNISEMSRAAGNIGLIRVWEHEMGVIGTAMNKAYTNWGEYQNWMNAGQNGEPPKLEARATEWSPDVIAAFKRIGKFNLDESNKMLGRVHGVADYVGEHGGKLQDVGISDEAAQILKPVKDVAEQRHREDLDSHDRIIINGRHYELPVDHTIDPSAPGFVKAGSYKASVAAVRNNVRPPPPPPQSFGAGAAPVPFAPSAPAPLPPAGGGGAPFADRFGAMAPPSAPAPAPARPGAGLRPMAATPAASLLQTLAPTPAAPAPAAPQQVAQSLPASWGVGATPAAPAAPAPAAVPAAAYNPATYNAGLERGESGGRNLPPNSSGASGYHQFRKETWNDNKPEGAPDEAYKATREQQDQARDNYTAKNAKSLAYNGVPVNNLTLAIAHNLGAGAGGAKTLLSAPDSDIALNHVNRASAAANPQFFWDQDGKQLTVAESKAKYAQFYRADGAAPAPVGGGSSLWDRLNPTAAKQAIQEKTTQAGVTRQGAASLITPAATAVGAIAGGAPGAIAGGVGGGMLEHYLTGDPDKQDAADLAEAGLWGGVKGGAAMIPGGPVAGPLMRIGAQTLIGGGEQIAKGADPKHVMAGTVGGAVGGAIGEGVGAAFSAALGPIYSKIFDAFTPQEQAGVRAAGKVIAEQKPKTMLADGSTVENKAYTAAEKTLNDRGIDPEHAAHGHNVTASPTSFGTAMATRPAAVEKRAAAGQLQDVVNQVGAAHAAQPNIATLPQLSHPSSIIRTDTNLAGTVPARFAGDAVEAGRQMAAPATNAGQKLDNFAKARTALLKKAEEARQMDPSPGRDEAVKAYTALGDHIRVQQEKVINHLLPPEQAQPLIDQLHAASNRYRNAVQAGGKDIVATIANGGARGNEAKAALDRFIGNDPVAKRWIDAMVKAHGSSATKDIAYVLAPMLSAGVSVTHAIPLVGPVIGGTLAAGSATLSVAKAKQAFSNYMVRKAAGEPVSFSDMIRPDLQPTIQGAKNVVRGATSAIGGALGSRMLTAPGRPAVSTPQVPISQ